VSPAKTAELTDLDGMWTWVETGNYVLDWGPNPHTRRCSFEARNGPNQDVPGHVQQSIYSLRLSVRQNWYSADASWGVLDGVNIGATW